MPQSGVTIIGGGRDHPHHRLHPGLKSTLGWKDVKVTAVQPSIPFGELVSTKLKHPINWPGKTTCLRIFPFSTFFLYLAGTGCTLLKFVD